MLCHRVRIQTPTHPMISVFPINTMLFREFDFRTNPDLAQSLDWLLKSTSQSLICIKKYKGPTFPQTSEKCSIEFR